MVHTLSQAAEGYKMFLYWSIFNYLSVRVRVRQPLNWTTDKPFSQDPTPCLHGNRKTLTTTSDTETPILFWMQATLQYHSPCVLALLAAIPSWVESGREESTNLWNSKSYTNYWWQKKHQLLNANKRRQIMKDFVLSCGSSCCLLWEYDNWHHNLTIGEPPGHLVV